MLRMLTMVMALLLVALAPAGAAPIVAQRVKVTVLSSMLADLPGRGEWGYAALVEVDGRRILFDAGAEPDTVIFNAKALGIDLADVEEVVISHNHWDHIGGLMPLRTMLMARNPKALSVLHVGAGAFLPGVEPTPRRDFATPFRASGGRIVVHDGPAEIAPGVWFTGPVKRVHPELNYGLSRRVISEGKQILDIVPEDSSLVIRTPEGLVVISGCGHAGVINIVTAARQIAGPQRIAALIGGLHLVNLKSSMVEWTAAQLQAVGVDYFMAGHCTGLEPTRRLAAVLGLGPDKAVYAPVGGIFERGKGIDARDVARAIPMD